MMDIYKRVSVFLILLVTFHYHVDSQSATDVKNLMTDKFVTNSYNRFIRPITDQSQAITVQVDFYLSSIIDFDAQNELLKTSGYLSCTWTDELLQWSPASFGGLDVLFVPQDTIWRPDLSLRNTYEVHRDSGLGSPYLNVRISSGGKVTWEPLEIFQSTCDVDITYYPFDVQECSLKITAWSYRQAEVVMALGGNGVKLNNYDENSVWELVSARSVALDTDETAVAFTIVLKRKPSFYLITLIVPILMLTVLNIASFILPIQSGERASYVITVFLSLVVFLTIYAEELPENSDTVSILAVYIIIMSSFSTLMVLVSLIQMRLIQRDRASPSVPVGIIYRALFWYTEAVRCRVCRRNKVKDMSGFVDDEDDERDEVTWSNVVSAIDFLFFWTSLFFTVIATSVLGFIAYAYSSQYSALEIQDEERFNHNI